MKNIFLILILVFTTIGCKAQSPIISVEDDANNDDFTEENAYVKDINNKFNPFIGTWKWEDTTTNSSFTIEFFKLEMVYDGEYYEDLLIGKYRFVKDGVELFNSLNLTGINASTIKNGQVWGKLIYSSMYRSDNYFGFHIYDHIKHKYCNADTEIITPILNDTSGNPITNAGAQMQWRMRLRNGPYVNEEFSSNDYMSYPTSIILTKQ